MFRKRSRLGLATAPPAEAPGDDGDAPAVTPRRSLSLSFGAEQGGGSLHGGTSLGAWAHGSAPAGDPGWAHQLWGQRDDGGEVTRWAAPQGAGPGACNPDDLDWQPSQPALAPGAPLPGGAFFSPRGAGGETWQGEAVMESPQAGPGGEAAAAEGRANSGANAWTRFASALAQAGSTPADGDGGTLSPGGSGRGGAAAVSGALDGSWGTDAREALYAPPWLGRAPFEPGHPGAGLRRDDTAAALACGGEGDEAHARAGCWAEPGASGHPQGLPAPLSDDDLSAGQRELQLQVRGTRRWAPQEPWGCGRYALGPPPLNCQLGRGRDQARDRAVPTAGADCAPACPPWMAIAPVPNRSSSGRAPSRRRPSRRGPDTRRLPPPRRRRTSLRRRPGLWTPGWMM